MQAGDSRTPRRFLALDVLRGFDMLWIVGGAGVVRAAAEAWPSGVTKALAAQTEHAAWDGFTLWDLVFPLFLFIAGAAMPFSLGKHRAAGVPRARLASKVVLRGTMLVLLGVVYNGALTFDFATLRYASVLGRIGLAYTGAALIYLYLGPRGRLVVLAALLLGYWAALAWVPVPGFGSGDLSPGRNLTDWIDQRLLPGRLHRGNRDPEGLLGTLPAVGTALLGLFAGLSLARDQDRRWGSVLRLAAAGVGLCLVGWLWHLVLPWNKNLWTGSFVLWTGGLSTLLLALTHAWVDVLEWRRGTGWLAVVGANAIAIYLLDGFVDFEAVVALLLQPGGRRLHLLFLPGSALALKVAIAAALYRRRIFLRV